MDPAAGHYYEALIAAGKIADWCYVNMLGGQGYGQHNSYDNATSNWREVGAFRRFD